MSSGKTGVIAEFKDEVEKEIIDRRRLNGCDGEDGTDGQLGGDGSHGEDAQDIYLKVSSKEGNILALSGSFECDFDMSNNCKNLFIIDSRGGNGMF